MAVAVGSTRRERAEQAELAEVQRSRVLGSAVQVVVEQGYARMSVSRVAGRAGVSRRTFYDLFGDREDCFLAVFDDLVKRVEERVLGAYRDTDGEWCERAGAGLAALLRFFEEEPAVCSLLVVESLAAGPRAQRRRAEVLGRLARALQREGAKAAEGEREVPPLTGEGVVGAVSGVLHARIASGRGRRLTELQGSLMAVIALPYLGPAAAQRELERPAPRTARASRRAKGERAALWSFSAGEQELLQRLPMRLTYRTLRVLSAVAELPGASNRTVGEAAGVLDQGQISKLLTRLQGLGLVVNSGPGHAHGERNAWRLTGLGEDVQRVTGIPGGSSARESSCVPRGDRKAQERARS